MKTIAARTLDQLKIDYCLRAYEVSEDELDAVSVARKVNMPPEATFKTLVTRGDKTGVILACVRATPNWILRNLPPQQAIKRLRWSP